MLRYLHTYCTRLDRKLAPLSDGRCAPWQQNISSTNSFTIAGGCGAGPADPATARPMFELQTTACVIHAHTYMGVLHCTSSTVAVAHGTA